MNEAIEPTPEIPLGIRMMKRAESVENESQCDQAIFEALDEIIAGESTAKKVLFYSALTSNSENKLHVFLFGKSQRGKSFCQSQLGRHLFSNISEDITDLSPKAIYYETKQKQNPALYRNKIVIFDEFNDHPDDTKAFIKKWASHRRGTMTHKTLDEKKQYIEIKLEGGPPVIWTNSMELVKDVGNQIHNRFFKLNVDESLAQAKTVEKYQIREETFGSAIDEDILKRGQMAISYIMEKGNFAVWNPFAILVQQKDYTTLNQRPMLHTLLSGISYSHWRWRPFFEMDGQRILLPALTDVYQAIELWNANEVYQRLAIPDYLRKLLDVLEPGYGRTKEEMADCYYERHKERLSADTCYNYAKKLEESNLATSRRREDDSRSRSYEWVSTISTVSTVELMNFNRETLAERIRLQFASKPLSSLSLSDTEIDKTVERLLNAKTPSEKSSKENSQTTFPR
jgi:hypothetical protein